MAQWKNFDHWSAKAFAWLMIVGGMFWLGYAIRDHYHYQHVCQCALKWEILPFVAGGLFIMFALAILSRKATEGAAAVVLPFATLVIERLGRRKTDAIVAVPTAPTAPPTTEDRGDKP